MTIGALVATAMMSLGSTFGAGTDPAAPDAADDAHAQPQGLLPVPDYSGDLWHSIRLTGDWGGTRTDLANKGVQIDVNFNQTVQSVVDGGRSSGTRYGGSLDYLLTLDLMRMGVLPGAMVKFRAETRYGEAANDIAGPLTPVNTDGFFPFGDSIDDTIPITLTNLTYYQFLSEQFGIVLGKIDTLDADPNEFASGRGTSQFMNANFVFPSSPLICLPAYSTLGAGVVVMPVKGVTVSSLVVNASDSSTTTGFEDFGDGMAWLTEAQFQYRIAALPGGANVGFVYGFDNKFFDIDGRFAFKRGEGIVAPTTEESWAVYWSAWQYLWLEEAAGEGPINTTDGKQDLQGIGAFIRAGIADDDTNPLDFGISVGLGAKGLIPTRDNDTCGVGFYYYHLETNRLIIENRIDSELSGIEAYYSLAITPAANLTFDLQVADSAIANVDTAVILGLRFNLAF